MFSSGWLTLGLQQLRSWNTKSITLVPGYQYMVDPELWHTDDIAGLIFHCSIKLSPTDTNVRLGRDQSRSMFAVLVVFFLCFFMLLEMHNANTRCWTTGVRERLVWSTFPGCASGRFCFLLWLPCSLFLGKSETKSREAIAGKEKGTGKWTLGRTEGESPHSMSDKEEAGVFWDGSVEHKCWQTETKKWDTVTFWSSFTAFPPP